MQTILNQSAMRFTKLLPLVWLLGSHLAFGQVTDSVATSTIPPKSDFKFGLLGETGFSIMSTSMPNLRSFFRSNQIAPDFHIDSFMDVNIGARYRRLKLMIHYGYNFNLFERHWKQGSASSVAQQNDASLSGASLGYDLANARNYRLYANVGFGSVRYAYSVYRTSEQTVSFQDITQFSRVGDIPSLTLSNDYWDINLEYAQREKRRSSGGSVTRLGYRRGLRGAAWQSEAFRLTGGPVDRIGQIYLQTTFSISYNYQSLRR